MHYPHKNDVWQDYRGCKFVVILAPVVTYTKTTNAYVYNNYYVEVKQLGLSIAKKVGYEDFMAKYTFVCQSPTMAALEESFSRMRTEF